MSPVAPGKGAKTTAILIVLEMLTSNAVVTILIIESAFMKLEQLQPPSPLLLLPSPQQQPQPPLLQPPSPPQQQQPQLAHVMAMGRTLSGRMEATTSAAAALGSRASAQRGRGTVTVTVSVHMV